MPVYHFNLRDGRAGVTDLEGTSLPNGAAARQHGVEVAQELMHGATTDHTENGCWRLEVCDPQRKVLFAISFAALDETLNHLDEETRRSVETLRESRRVLSETIFRSELLFKRAQAIEARRQGRPYLAACAGQVVLPPRKVSK